MNTKTKKRGFVITVVTLSLVALMLIGLTLAYLTDQRNTLNVMGIGAGGTDPNNPVPTVKVTLTEPKFVEESTASGETPTAMANGETGEYSEVRLMNIVPGQLVNKDPQVTNVGADDVFIRIRLQDNDGAEIKLDAGTLNMMGATATSDWTYVNGYYYYTKGTSNCAVLASGASAVKFFAESEGTQVNMKDDGTTESIVKKYTMSIPKTMTNESLKDYLGVLNLNIVAEAIQAKSFVPDLTATHPWNMGGTESGTPVPIIPAIRP